MGSIGRNEPCPCLSGAKFKKCHGSPQAQRSAGVYDKNVALLRHLAEIFGLRPGVAWDDVKRRVTPDRVRALHLALRHEWSGPLSTVLPSPSKRLTALYLGEIDPNDLARRIFRFGLYADRILVINPFLVPSPRGESPVETPDKYIRDTIKLLYFVYRVYPWIESGLVTLIGDPMMYDSAFREHAYDAATKRRFALEIDPRDFDASGAKEEWRRTIASMPPASLEAFIRKRSPELSESELRDLLDDFDDMRKNDPLSVVYEDDGPNKPPSSEFMVSRGGSTLEGALAIGQATGAFPYTYSHTKWRELMAAAGELPERAQIWSPLTRAFQALDFQFLNNVDSDFAKRVREEGRMMGFRQFLQDLWSKIDGSPDDARAEMLAQEFSERLAEEHRRASEEWKKIDRDLIASQAPSVAGMAGTAALVLWGSLQVLPTEIAIGVATLTSGFFLNRSSQKRSEFRVSVPMSVFVDLSSHRS